MAFPGTLNINYYKGDTYEFRIYPKNSDGSIFDLTPYTSTSFTISTVRGSAGSSTAIEAYTEVSADGSNILCVILPGHGASLTAGTTYVYDVQIRRSGPPYERVYSLVTGSISVQDDVTQSVPGIDTGNSKYRVIYVDTANTDGSIPKDTTQYTPGQTATILTTTLTRPGYTLTGWNTNSSGTGTTYIAGNTVTMPSSDLYLYSKWQAN